MSDKSLIEETLVVGSVPSFGSSLALRGALWDSRPDSARACCNSGFSSARGDRLGKANRVIADFSLGWESQISY